MSKVAFTAWPKIPRLNKPMVITEKMDGSNAAIGIRPLSEFIYQADTFFNGHEDTAPEIMDGVIATANSDKWGTRMGIYAQSRTRVLLPDSIGGKGSDNFGFARWVEENFVTLIDDLGPGLHFGEWWGQGIQRNYGLDHKRFSLFNVGKWADKVAEFETPNVDTVPILVPGYEFDTQVIRQQMGLLKAGGSRHPLAEGFKAEGVVVFHAASGQMYKYLLDHTDTPKDAQVGYTRDADGNLVKLVS